MKCTKCGQTVLKVGDRVEAIGKVDGLDLKGRRGVVVRVDNVPLLPVCVKFDKFFKKGHDGFYGGLCKDGHGRWGEHEDFKVIPPGKKPKKKT